MLLLAAGFGLYTSRLWDRIGELEARAAEASQRITQAEQQVVQVQKASEQRVGDLQQAAVRAQRVAEILAAPDLLRIDLGPTPRGGGAYAQVLWSRSRGLVASASRLPRTRPGRAYQLWVLTDGPPVSAGLLELDGTGRGSLLIGEPLTFPRRLGFVVTGEPEGGSPSPAGLVYLRERQ
jgi:anti-sigma-K factor RskA